MFAYYASSLCITVVLAAFLAILVDPLVVMLEKLHMPRGVAAGVVVLAFIALIGLLGHDFHRRGTSFAEQLPAYTSKLQQAIEPLIQKIEKIQQSAADVQPNFLNLFMKTLIRDRVVPTISASISCDTLRN